MHKLSPELALHTVLRLDAHQIMAVMKSISVTASCML